MFPNDFQSYYRSIISSNLYKKKLKTSKNQSSSLSDYNNNEGAEQEYKRQIFAPALWELWVFLELGYQVIVSAVFSWVCSASSLLPCFVFGRLKKKKPNHLYFHSVNVKTYYHIFYFKKTVIYAK
jgi:hypothetical protein